jgi:uncharacterized repeat protein (TIGR01451 family)
MSRERRAFEGLTVGIRSLGGRVAGRRSPRLGIAAALCVAALGAWALPAAPARAEGSVDFNTGADTRFRNGLSMQSGAAGRYTVLRVYARAGETIQMASNAMQHVSVQDNILVYPRGTDFVSSTDPSLPAQLPSDPVFATDVFDCNTDDAGTGRIASRAEELAGPAPNPGGYTPCEYTVPPGGDGIYPIIMIPTNPGFPGVGGGTVGAPSVGGSHAQLALWDVTVRDAGGAVQPGRLFSHRLALAEASASATTTGPQPVSYLYTPAGYQYRVSFFNHHGQVWEMAVNDRGVVDAATGERKFASFQWGLDDSSNVFAHGDAIAPQLQGRDLAADSRFPIFFRPVDPVAISGAGGLGQTRGYASAPISPSAALSGLAFIGAGGEQAATAQGSGGTIRFASPSQMDGLGYTVELDLNQNGAFGDSGDVVDDSGDLNAAGGNTFAWNGQNPGGATPACGSYAYRVRATLAEAHLTMSDVEASAGTQIERLSLPGDPALGDPLAASYNDTDPYKGTAVTDASPVAVTAGTSGLGFHAWGPNTGNADFVDTWMRLPEVVSSGTLQVRCPDPVHDLSVKKTASRSRATVGDTITYTLTASNAGPDAAPDVTVSDTAPSELDVRSATTSQGHCAVTGNKVSCPVGTLAAGSSAKVTVQAVAIKAGLTTNTAIVDSPPPAVDPPANDTAKATVRIVKPTLDLTKTVDRTTLRAGSTATYTIRVRNPSKRGVRNVRVCDRLPAGLTYIDSKATAKLTKSGYCWTTKALWAGRSQTYRITVRALSGTSGRKVNRASANSAGANTADATRTIRVLAARVLGGGVTG